MRRFVLLMIITVCLVSLVSCSDDDPVQIPDEPVVVEHEVLSHQFMRNRFFRLTSDFEATPIPMAHIDHQSIKIFQRVLTDGPIQPGELENVAAFADVTGDWVGNDFTETPAVYGARWREIELNYDFADPDWSFLADENAFLRGIDMGSNLGDHTELAVTFRYHTGPDTWAPVGDDVNEPRSHMIFDEGVPVEGEWYHMKLLKAAMTAKNAYAHALMMRQVYSLAAGNLDPDIFSMRIERNDPSAPNPALDENGVPYLQIFGLDNGDNNGQGERDGEPDLFSRMMFDLRKGILIFPDDFTQPFAATRGQYEANTVGTPFTWEEEGFLADHLAPELYDVETSEADLPRYGYFRMVMEHEQPGGG